MQHVRAITLAIAALVGAGVLAAPQAAQAQAQKLVWEDNFDGPMVDANKWTYELGNGCQIGLCGWGNNELESYTNRPENVRIEDGSLVIEARRETAGDGSAFTSARLKSEGRMHFKYGTLEARIKVPKLGNGLWPAYWMLGTIGVWPARGEIDLLEMGNAAAIADNVVNKRVGAAVHWDFNGSQADYGRDYNSTTDLTDDYHVYRTTWDPNFLTVFIDGNEYFKFDISKIEEASLQEFHHQYFVLLNLAVGGNYTGVPTAAGVTAPLPGKMLVDYIRLYQDDPASELFVGTDAATRAGRFCVYSEQLCTAGKLTYNGDADLFLWNNLTPIPAVPYQGRDVMSFRAKANDWYGLGILTDYRNMGAYAGGVMTFRMRTTTPSPFRIGISSAAGDSWVPFAEGGEQFGLVRDGNWHEVRIPFSTFQNLDLKAVKQMFMMVSDPPPADVEFAIDNVEYEALRNGRPWPVHQR